MFMWPVGAGPSLPGGCGREDLASLCQEDRGLLLKGSIRPKRRGSPETPGFVGSLCLCGHVGPL